MGPVRPLGVHEDDAGVGVPVVVVGPYVEVAERPVRVAAGGLEPGVGVAGVVHDQVGDDAQDLGLDEPGLNRVIRARYKLLNLQTYFTAGVKEVRAWTIHVGDTGPQAAGVIHTDFERGYIRAQTIAFDDYIAFKGEQGAKDAGKMRAEGKEYVVKDGDVMNFLFSS